MANTYWMGSESVVTLLDKNLSDSQRSRVNILAALPISNSLVIELDLQGIEPPKLFPLSEDLQASLRSQRSATAQIFLCASSKDASSIFESRQIKSSVEYINAVKRQPSRFQHNPEMTLCDELLMPYDPRRLEE
ncbi:unnamed protein product [Alternaria burnsii]|nr:unnamed protein product [Alternaria burnsii]